MDFDSNHTWIWMLSDQFQVVELAVDDSETTEVFMYLIYPLVFHLI